MLMTRPNVMQTDSESKCRILLIAQGNELNRVGPKRHRPSSLPPWGFDKSFGVASLFPNTRIWVTVERTVRERCGRAPVS
jgi:hypothetical protein